MFDAIGATDGAPPIPLPIPSRVSDYLFVRPHTLLVAGVCLLVLTTATLALVLEGSFRASVLFAVVALIVGLLVARMEDQGDRLWSVALFVCALAVRLAATAMLHYFAVRGGGPFLGPDSLKYWSGSSELAARGFYLDDLPQIYFGSFDVGQYYLFAAAIRFGGADVFGLQVLNSCLSALMVPFLFGAVRVVLPRATLPVAAISAFAPSLLVLSSIDLLKDASVMCATTALVWATLRLTAERYLSRMAFYTAVGLGAGLYLHISRFYSFAYVELAFVMALVVVGLRGKSRAYRRWTALAAACSIFIVSEVLPTRADWPPSGVMVAATVSYTLGTPSLRHYASGLFDQVRRRQTAPESEVDVGKGLIAFTVNLVRRMYGPFIWILPSQWSFEALQRAEFFLYPGMLLWYALIPFVLVGISVAGWRIFRGCEKRFGIVFLWIFTTIYFAQYTLINLSYRQRDVMLPLLLVFAFVGISALNDVRRWKRWYAAYWALLLATAVAHLAVRMALGL